MMLVMRCPPLVCAVVTAFMFCCLCADADGLTLVATDSDAIHDDGQGAATAKATFQKRKKIQVQQKQQPTLPPPVFDFYLSQLSPENTNDVFRESLDEIKEYKNPNVFGGDYLNRDLSPLALSSSEQISFRKDTDEGSFRSEEKVGLTEYPSGFVQHSFKNASHSKVKPDLKLKHSTKSSIPPRVTKQANHKHSFDLLNNISSESAGATPLQPSKRRINNDVNGGIERVTHKVKRDDGRASKESNYAEIKKSTAKNSDTSKFTSEEPNFDLAIDRPDRGIGNLKREFPSRSNQIHGYYGGLSSGSIGTTSSGNNNKANNEVPTYRYSAVEVMNDSADTRPDYKFEDGFETLEEFQRQFSGGKAFRGLFQGLESGFSEGKASHRHNTENHYDGSNSPYEESQTSLSQSHSTEQNNGPTAFNSVSHTQSSHHGDVTHHRLPLNHQRHPVYQSPTLNTQHKPESESPPHGHFGSSEFTHPHQQDVIHELQGNQYLSNERFRHHGHETRPARHPVYTDDHHVVEHQPSAAQEHFKQNLYRGDRGKLLAGRHHSQQIHEFQRTPHQHFGNSHAQQHEGKHHEGQGTDHRHFQSQLLPAEPLHEQFSHESHGHAFKPRHQFNQHHGFRPVHIRNRHHGRNPYNGLGPVFEGNLHHGFKLTHTVNPHHGFRLVHGGNSHKGNLHHGFRPVHRGNSHHGFKPAHDGNSHHGFKPEHESNSHHGFKPAHDGNSHHGFKPEHESNSHHGYSTENEGNAQHGGQDQDAGTSFKIDESYYEKLAEEEVQKSFASMNNSKGKRHTHSHEHFYGNRSSKKPRSPRTPRRFPSRHNGVRDGGARNFKSVKRETLASYDNLDGKPTKFESDLLHKKGAFTNRHEFNQNRIKSPKHNEEETNSKEYLESFGKTHHPTGAKDSHLPVRGFVISEESNKENSRQPHPPGFVQSQGGSGGGENGFVPTDVIYTHETPRTNTQQGLYNRLNINWSNGPDVRPRPLIRT